MISFKVGDILKSQTDAIVNTVNTKGVMGKGIALAFKKAYPKNFKIYEKACKEGEVEIGKMLITETGELFPKYIINFPSKKHWRNPSKYEFIEKGLEDLIRVINEYNVQSISIPPLGSGNGRLDWMKVKDILTTYLKDIANDIEIVIFEPGYNDQIVSKPEKEISLTPARAIFVYLLKKYQVLGYQINLLVAQKMSYFMQRFGEELNLDFEKGHYGPFSNNLTHLLKYINQSFISYNQNNNSPGTTLEIRDGRYNEVERYFDNNLDKEQKARAEKTLELIRGFESPYGLELLATIDFIVSKTNAKDISEIAEEITNWTKRKKTIMKPKHIELAYQRLKEFNLI